MLKRSRSRSPQRQRAPKSPRRDDQRSTDRYSGGRGGSRRNLPPREDAHTAAWVAGEDDFVLKQARKKAKIRVREGRGRPIDQLAVALAAFAPGEDLLEEESAVLDVKVRHPRSVVDELDEGELRSVKGDVEKHAVLEKGRKERRFWEATQSLISDRLAQLGSSGPSGGRGHGAVAADIDKVLAPKTREQLAALEETVKQKLDSDEALDEEYWEQLLARIGVFQARAELDRIYQDVVAAMWETRKKEQVVEAEGYQRRYRHLATAAMGEGAAADGTEPEPLLSIPEKDKGLRVMDEKDFLANVAKDRKRVRQEPPRPASSQPPRTMAPTTSAATSLLARPAGANEDYSSATTALYDREAARGVDEDEEVFTDEVAAPASKPLAVSLPYRPRKPRYFNRVQMGYEWNKYNQTHYDYDNAPPKVVQGYKFNIFYPELLDKTKAPTYRVEREGGRKRGQSFAPAGEEDTCLIRFIGGPPYEDIAFRIVDREWDYSARRERGFRSSFDKGILQLHFHFKKVYYRK